MRKLVYEINDTLTVNTFAEAKKAKEMGYTVKEKMLDIDTELHGKALRDKVIAEKKKKNAAALAE